RHRVDDLLAALIHGDLETPLGSRIDQIVDGSLDLRLDAARLGFAHVTETIQTAPTHRCTAMKEPGPQEAQLFVSSVGRDYSSSIWLYMRLSWISYRASIASITEAGFAWASTVTSGDSSMTLLIATESTGGICRWSARFSISSSLRSLSMWCILLRRAYLARWIRRSRAVMCSIARLACLIIGIFPLNPPATSLGRPSDLSRTPCNKSV